MDNLERVIRPIVEGQIRGLIKEHPSILRGVDWYKDKRRNAADVLIGSLSKRIVRDLTCAISRARLAAALLAPRTEASSDSSVARSLPRTPSAWLLGLCARVRRRASRGGGMMTPSDLDPNALEKAVQVFRYKYWEVCRDTPDAIASAIIAYFTACGHGTLRQTTVEKLKEQK